MPLEKTYAFVLKSYDWSESSRTISFFTRNFGKLSLVDKGGRSLTSKRGRVVPFSELEITFYESKKESSGYISDVEMIRMFELSGDGSLGRLAYASAAVELLQLLLPKEEPLIDLYEYAVSFLEKVDQAKKQALASLFLTFFLRLLSQLGYHPSLGYCGGCDRSIESFIKDGAAVRFSPERGGIVCPSCQNPGEYYIGLPYEGFLKLVELQTASLNEAEKLTLGFKETSLLLDALVKFLEYQADISQKIKSLEFLDKLKNAKTLME
jgi:DNA repair protein RecO (recombination protein O)